MYRTEIYDDGGKGSLHIRWENNDIAYVTLNGCEMEEKNIRIEFTNNKIKFIEQNNSEFMEEDY